MLVLAIVFAALVGATLGSFGAVVASRGLRASIGGRSRCDSCGRTLAWYELVPLVSVVALRGRCRTCGASIGWSPFLWEVGGALVAIGFAVPIVLVFGGAG